MPSLEFFNSPDGTVEVKQEGQQVKALTPKDVDLIDLILSMVENRYPEAFKALSAIYQKSAANVPFYRYQMASRFIRCNFGEFDLLRLDIDDNLAMNTEEVKCPLRGTGDCPFDHIICHPRLSTQLTDREILVLHYIACGYKSSQIAEALHISVFTVIKHRNNARHKLGLQNTMQLINYYNNTYKDERRII